MPEDEQAKIAAMPEDELIMLHFGLGQWIRNHLGLWRGNAALLVAAAQGASDILPALPQLADWSPSIKYATKWAIISMIFDGHSS